MGKVGSDEGRRKKKGKGRKRRGKTTCGSRFRPLYFLRAYAPSPRPCPIDTTKRRELFSAPFAL